MKFLERRRPVGWAPVIVAALLTASAVYSLYYGDAFIAGRRGEASRHILRATRPAEFHFQVRFALSAATILYFIGLVRLVPLANGFSQLKSGWQRKIAAKGYDKQPAPWWGYVIFVGALALVIWIGKVTMYSE